MAIRGIGRSLLFIIDACDTLSRFWENQKPARYGEQQAGPESDELSSTFAGSDSFERTIAVNFLNRACASLKNHLGRINLFSQC
jgi:hypothetical protein